MATQSSYKLVLNDADLRVLALFTLYCYVQRRSILREIIAFHHAFKSIQSQVLTHACNKLAEACDAKQSIKCIDLQCCCLAMVVMPVHCRKLSTTMNATASRLLRLQLRIQ